MIMALDAPPGTPIDKDSWDGYGVERARAARPRGASGHPGRRVPDRRHPHVLRRRRWASTAAARRASRPSSWAARSRRSGSPRRSRGRRARRYRRADGGDHDAASARPTRTCKYDEQESRGYGISRRRRELKVEFKAVDARALDRGADDRQVPRCPRRAARAGPLAPLPDGAALRRSRSNPAAS